MNINEIAKLAGVSRATVSRYLNQGYVSKEKKEQIQKVIDETGYRPSAQAQTMRTRKTYLIGVIIPKINSDSISLVVKGITRTLAEAGYQVLLANTENDEKEELRYLEVFQQHQVDGILFLGTILTRDHKSALRKLKTPIVLLGQFSDKLSCVFHDDFHAMKALAMQVLQKGDKIGYIGVTKQDEAVGQQRFAGFLEAVRDLHKGFLDSCYREAEFSIDSGYTQAKALLYQHPELDTLICATDSIALGAMRCLKEMGRKIPEDVQVAGMGASRMSEICEPNLSTVKYYYEKCGTEGARILLEQLNEEHVPVCHTRLAYEVLLRGSARQ